MQLCLLAPSHYRLSTKANKDAQRLPKEPENCYELVVAATLERAST
jgi:hypothetical protein